MKKQLLFYAFLVMASFSVTAQKMSALPTHTITRADTNTAIFVVPKSASQTYQAKLGQLSNLISAASPAITEASSGVYVDHAGATDTVKLGGTLTYTTTVQTNYHSLIIGDAQNHAKAQYIYIMNDSTQSDDSLPGVFVNTKNGLFVAGDEFGNGHGSYTKLDDATRAAKIVGYDSLVIRTRSGSWWKFDGHNEQLMTNVPISIGSGQALFVANNSNTDQGGLFAGGADSTLSIVGTSMGISFTNNMGDILFEAPQNAPHPGYVWTIGADSVHSIWAPGGGGGSSDLQDVCNVGFHTTTNIETEGSLIAGTPSTTGFLKMFDFANSGNFVTFVAPSLTSSFSLEIPDCGTKYIATSVNGSYADGTGNVTLDTINSLASKWDLTNLWSTTGNAGTNSNVNHIGTNDTSALSIIQNGVEEIRIGNGFVSIGYGVNADVYASHAIFSGQSTIGGQINIYDQGNTGYYASIQAGTLPSNKTCTLPDNPVNDRFAFSFMGNGADVNGDLQADTTAILATKSDINKNGGSYSATGVLAQTDFIVTHGLPYTPSQVVISPTTAGTAAAYYILSKDATTFTVRFVAAPGVVAVGFDWIAKP